MSAPRDADRDYDPRQRFVRLVPGGNGTLFGVQADGGLIWYRHADWRGGSRTWAPGSGRRIGDGFHRFRAILAAADGQLFCFGTDGTVRWYRYTVTDSESGDGRWTHPDGTVIGTGFEQFPRVFGGWDGVLYCVDDNGSLWWYRYTAGDGSSGPGAWARGGVGAVIGMGCKEYVRMFADPNGVIYGVRQGGSLHWWRYLAGNGDPTPWANGGRTQIINFGWDEGTNRAVVSCASGTLYLVESDSANAPGPDHRLLWYRILNSETVDRDGGANFANGNNGGKLVGEGFTVDQSAALQGYALKLNSTVGDSIAFAVSSGFKDISGTAVRLAPGGPTDAAPPIKAKGSLQQLPDTFRSTGCGWRTTFTLKTTKDWRSGVYAMRLTSPGGGRHHVLFTLRPAAPVERLAFLLPVNTYSAYSTWGGHSQYTVGEAQAQRTVTWHRPGLADEADPPAKISHTLHSDLLLLNWLHANGYAYDTYTDKDLHEDGGWLPRYRALVLGSHPEYWSDPMRQRLLEFLTGGGRVIYPGGNALYERVAPTADGSAVTFRKPGGANDFYRGIGKSEADIVGGVLNTPAYMDFYPYKVLADHPLLRGTGLRVGDTFGHSGYNGAASGWEVDVIPGATPTTVHHFAKGQNPAGGADMMVVDHGTRGGWVFSVSSIAFAGALGEPTLARVMRNALDAALS